MPQACAAAVLPFLTEWDDRATMPGASRRTTRAGSSGVLTVMLGADGPSIPRIMAVGGEIGVS